MGSRTWVKIYCDKWLSGTLREETPALRGIWADLIALAGSGKYGDTGQISLQNGVGLSDLQFQKVLNLSRKGWQKAKTRLSLTERIAVNSQNVITILNWKKYQSDYERQGHYRNKKLQPKVTTESYTGDRDRDRDIREGKVTKINTRKYKVVN